MAVERPISGVATVGPLVDAVPQDQSFIRAARRNPGTRLLVDDAADPSVALLVPTVGDVVFLGGRENGRDDALAVISASTDNIELMHQGLEQQAEAAGVPVSELRPEQWLSEFYDQRKGSGKGKGKEPVRSSGERYARA